MSFKLGRNHVLQYCSERLRRGVLKFHPLLKIDFYFGCKQTLRPCSIRCALKELVFRGNLNFFLVAYISDFILLRFRTLAKYLSKKLSFHFYEVNIHTLPNLLCIRLVSVNHLPLKCIRLVFVQSSLTCINIGVRIEVTGK